MSREVLIYISKHTKFMNSLESPLFLTDMIESHKAKTNYVIESNNNM